MSTKHMIWAPMVGAGAIGFILGSVLMNIGDGPWYWFVFMGACLVLNVLSMRRAYKALVRHILDLSFPGGAWTGRR